MLFIIGNFTLAGILLVIGVLTLRKVSCPSEWLFASLPLLFGLHQFVQGIVWLGIYHVGSPTTFHIASTVFVFYAQAALPFIVPLAIWLLEPDNPRHKSIGGLTLLGFFLAIYVSWGLITTPTEVAVQNGSLVYANPHSANIWIALAYILTTCGSLILSRSISIQLFGWFNLIGLTAVYIIAQYSFTALWCLYAATISGILYLHFVERRIEFLQTINEGETKISQSAQLELDRLSAHLPRLRRLFLNKGST